MNRLPVIAALIAALALVGASIAEADQGPAWWIVQQNIAQQQAEQAAAPSITLQVQANAFETQRALNALQLRSALDGQIGDLRNIQQNKRLQILQVEINAANDGKSKPKKAAPKTKSRPESTEPLSLLSTVSLAALQISTRIFANGIRI